MFPASLKQWRNEKRPSRALGTGVWFNLRSKNPDWYIVPECIKQWVEYNSLCEYSVWYLRTVRPSIFYRSKNCRRSFQNVSNNMPLFLTLTFVGRTGKDELLDTAMALHDAAMKDEYFVKRKLAPNVDFWWASSWILQHLELIVLFAGGTRRMNADWMYSNCLDKVVSYIALWVRYWRLFFIEWCSLLVSGFPLDFFPVLFAVPRVVGWLAHWRQMMLQEGKYVVLYPWQSLIFGLGGVKIWRPRQVRAPSLRLHCC